MRQTSCPHCGELLTYSPDQVGRQVRCAYCNTELLLDTAPVEPQRPARRWLRRLTLPATLFLTGLSAGLVAGFWLGQASVAGQDQSGGLHFNASSFFGSASNNVNLTDSPAPTPGQTGRERRP